MFHKASFDVNSGFTLFFGLLVLNQLAIKQACWKRTQLIESFLEKKHHPFKQGIPPPAIVHGPYYAITYQFGHHVHGTITIF